MSRSPTSIAATLLVLALTGLAPVAGAEGSPPKLARFAEEGALSVDLENPAQALVLNDSVSELTLTASLDGPVVMRQVEGGDPEPHAGLVVLASGDSVELPVGGSARVVLEAVPEAERPPLEPGSYSGYLVLTSTPHRLVLRRAVELTVPAAASEPPPSLPQPLFGEWTIPFARYVPFTRDWVRPGYLPYRRRRWTGYLPVAPVQGELAAPPAAPIGHLAADGQHAATVHWIDTVDGRARLEVSGIDPFTSKYQGDVQLQPGAEGKVTLTVKIKDHWLWAVLCLALGIWAWRRLEQFLQVRRGVWKARERNAQLGIDFAAAQKRFHHAVEGHGGGTPPWSHFTISPDMGRRRAAVSADLDQLEGLVLQAVESNEEYKAVQAELERLEATTASWPGFAAELAALDTARANVAAQPLDPPRGADPKPTCLKLPAALLAPMELGLPAVPEPGNELGSYFERRKQVIAGTALLGSWLELAERVAEQRKLRKEIEQSDDFKALPTDHADYKARLEIGDDLTRIWSSLWRLESEAGLAALAGSLDASRGRLAPLAERYLPEPQAEAVADLAMPAADALREAWAAADARAAAPTDDRERRDYYAALRQRYEGVTLVVAFALALVSGLNALYVGTHEFATPWHYVQALTWGAGTKLALDTVLAAIGHLPALARAVRGGR